ncbi:hypothetical protein AR685_17380 [Chryseobacterium sp. JAH]|nr:hypothetical protein AR685_17380 [Chryseobacterium sp. JAH]
MSPFRAGERHFLLPSHAHPVSGDQYPGVHLSGNPIPSSVLATLNEMNLALLKVLRRKICTDE